MILGIDSSKVGKTLVYLKDGKEQIVKSLTEVQKPGSQVLLPMVKKILRLKKLSFNKLTAVEVNCGPGSFTGLRVGVAVANAIGYGLKIPVNKAKVGQLVIPKYQ